MDGIEVGRRVRAYFETVHGRFSLYDFRIEAMELDENSQMWNVECSFFSSPNSEERLHYELDVDDESGEIAAAERVEA